MIKKSIATNNNPNLIDAHNEAIRGLPISIKESLSIIKSKFIFSIISKTPAINGNIEIYIP